MLCLIILFLNVFADGARIPEEEKTPIYLSALVGDSALFVCDLDFPHGVVVPYTLMWNKEGDRVFSVQDGIVTYTKDGYAGRVALSVENGRANLNLTAVREPDHGWYECRLFFPNRTPTTRLNGTWFHLTVHGSDILEVPPMNKTVKEGETAEMDCVSKEKKARVTWYKDGIPISSIPSLSGRTVVRPEGSLIIAEAQPSDPGFYKCEVVATSGQAQSALAYLNVHYKARVIYTPGQVFLPIGKPGAVDCHFIANPPLTKLRWEKDGFLFDPYNVPGVVSRSNGTLFFDKVEESHGGEYTCTPNNELGTTGPSEGIHVVVQHPPVFTVTPHNMYLRKPGDTIQMSCDALDGDTRPTIIWFKKDGTPLPTDRAVISGGNLTITNIKESDRGIYQCVASNEAATISADTELLIENSTPRGPHNLTGEPGINSVKLSWRPGIMAVSAQVRAVDSPEWRTIKVSGSKATISSLDPGREYELMVLSQDHNGDGMFSKPIRITTKGVAKTNTLTTEGIAGPLNVYLPCQPNNCKFLQGRLICVDKVHALVTPTVTSSPDGIEQARNWESVKRGSFNEIESPKNIKVSASEDGYILSWDAPIKGLEFVDHYEIVKFEGLDDSLPLVSSTQETSFLVGDLSEDIMYHFRLKAVATDGAESSFENLVLHVPALRKTGTLSLFLAALIGFIVATILLCVYINRRQLQQLRN